MKIMMRRLPFLSLIGLLVALPALGGCAAVQQSGKTPEQWLSESYAQLAAKDHYAFTGSTSIGMEDGVMFKPQTFEGKITNHKQLTVQAEEQSAFGWSPIETLESLLEHNSGVVIAQAAAAGADNTITLQVKADAARIKRQWEELLRQQLDMLAINAPSDDAEAAAKWKRELELARAELEQMLAAMQAEAQYDIVIDKSRVVPVKLDETTIFRYTKAGRAVQETRHTTVKFQDIGLSPEQTGHPQ